MKFSERMGIKEVKSTIQMKSMDDELRNSLWNVLTHFCWQPLRNNRDINTYKTFIEALWLSFFKEPTDKIPCYESETISLLRKRFFEWEWYDVYDFIEFVVKISEPRIALNLIDKFHFILKRELSGYRFINKKLTPISDENQVSEIQNALNETKNTKLNGVNIHLQTALEKLSDKKNPDYRNSIKESISAVEALAQIISGNKKTDLRKALQIIKDKLGLHSALEQGFIKLYAYTSDGDGIRHALMDEPNLDLEDAIYMLTSCSAFVNYLIIKADKADIKIS